MDGFISNDLQVHYFLSSYQTNLTVQNSHCVRTEHEMARHLLQVTDHLLLLTSNVL